MRSRDGAGVVPRWVRGALWFGLAAVVLYVAGWAVAGQVRADYDPLEQAISELFALGAPWSSRGLLLAGLVLSGIAFLWLAPALHARLSRDFSSGCSTRSPTPGTCWWPSGFCVGPPSANAPALLRRQADPVD